MHAWKRGSMISSFEDCINPIGIATHNMPGKRLIIMYLLLIKTSSKHLVSSLWHCFQFMLLDDALKFIKKQEGCVPSQGS